MTDTDLEQRLERLAASYADRPVDTAASWRRLTQARVQAARARRRAVAVAAAGVTVVAIAIPAVAYQLHSGDSANPRASRPPNDGHLAITARIAVPGAGGAVGDEAMAGRVVAVDGQVWTITYSHRLIRIDPATNRVDFDESIAGLNDIAAGAGSLWVLVAVGNSSGRLLRVDPVTGRVISAFPLSQRCVQVLYARPQLWLTCGAAYFVRLDPTNGRILARTGRVYDVIQAAASPDGIWYVGSSGIAGFLGTGAQLHWVHVDDSVYPVSFLTTGSLLYADGSLWALTSDESVARIDPVTGKIIRVYGYRNFDPNLTLGLDFMTVGFGSFWFLEHNGASAVSVLRASLATGRPQGSVTDYAGACGEPCWQISVAGGSVWVPTRTWITRIDPVSPRRPRRTASR